MERAPLRPVPSHPPGPIPPAEAFRYVSRELPDLDGRAAGALAMVALVGLPRKEIGTLADPAEVAGLSGEALAEALARGRKALRRRLYPLPGSGWCERAERLISDRLDDALEDPGPRRLEVHLANCGRCVEHERRLAQSQESLVAGFVEAHSAAESEPDSAPPAGEAETEVEAESPAVPPVLRAVDTPILPAAPEPETLPSRDPSQDALPPGAAPEPAQLEGESGEPGAQLEQPPAERREEPIRLGPARAASEEPPAEEPTRVQEPPAAPEEASSEEEPPRLEEQSAAPAEQSPVPAEQPPPPPEERPAAAVPSARRRSSTTLWTPSAPSPPRMPLTADPPRRPALRPSPPVAGAPPPPLPVAPTAPAPASGAPTAAAMPSAPPSDAPPEPPSPAPWTSDPPRPWGPALSPPAATPNAWRSDAPRPSLAAHRSLESESVWTAIGPLVAVLSVAVVIAVLAGMLALGG